MKKRFLSRSRSFILPAACLAIRGSACAATPVTGPLINVDFNSTTGSTGGPTDPVTFDGDLAQNASTAASVALEDANAANDIWNGFDAPNQTNQPLVDSTGAATLLKLTWSGFSGTYTNYVNEHGENRTEGPNGDGHVLNTGAAGTGTVTVGGLDPAVSYDVVVISPGSDPVLYGIGFEEQSVARWHSANNPSNWVQFQGIIPDGAGRITVRVMFNGTNNYGIGGLQITPVGTVSDADGDGMADLWEDANSLNSSDPADGSLVISALTDPDGDGVANRTEFQNNTNPNNSDTDSDSYGDKVETKTGVWANLDNTGTDPLKKDSDGDGLMDGDENPDLAEGSDPNKIDTDSDGFTDAIEVANGTNPKDPNSSLRTVVPEILVNYDFNGDEDGISPLPVPILFDGNLTRNATTSASVGFEDAFPTANDLWNGALGLDPQEALKDIPQRTKDSKGYPSDVTVKWSGFANNYTNYTNGRDGGGGFTSGPNGDGFYAKTTATPTVTLGGLTEGVIYDVAALGAGDPVKFIIDGQEKTLARWHSTQNSSNWAVFTGLNADANGEIVLTVASVDGASNFGIGGVQIAYAGTPVNFPKEITNIVRDPATGGITLTWTSVAGKSYTVLWGTDPASFPSSVTGLVNLPGAGGTMSRTFAPPVADAARLFFRVREE